MQISDEMVEKAAEAIFTTWAQNRGVSENWAECTHLHHSIVDEAREEARAALTAALAGHVVVPKAALAWLFGEAPDAEGKWFGDCEDDVKPIAGKYKRTYWWRSKFRAMIDAASQVSRGE